MYLDTRSLSWKMKLRLTCWTVELNRQGIPHVMVSYRDAALDGLFQTLRGWGHVEAPDEAKEQILLIIKEITQEPQGPQENRG